MLPKALLERIYEAANIERWNDHMRPGQGFTELDKQAHKMVYAYVIGKLEERAREVDWVKLIEGGLFEFLHRIVLTDIKPPVFHRLMQKRGPEVNEWVLERLRSEVEGVPGGFLLRFAQYLMDPQYSFFEKRLLRAAHYLATNWEFKIIYRLNSSIFGVEETKAQIEDELEEHYDLASVQMIELGRKTHHFLDLVGQLRFQRRWAQSPRVPVTSVMGHMLVVAILSYFVVVELDPCERRIYNNYFGGLFHDLPEVLTRDIVSPVKRSVEGLEEIIKDIEETQVEERILPLIPRGWHAEIRYFVQDEFKSKILLKDGVKMVTSCEINEKYNDNRYSPYDGELIRACDHLAAYIEACLSLMHGISSRHLEEGRTEIYKQYKGRTIAGVDFGQLFDYFAE